MKVQVLLFSTARECVGRPALPVSVPEDARVRDLFADPALAPLAPYRDSLRAAVNEEFSSFSSPLKDGDVVALLPPVSGG